MNIGKEEMMDNVDIFYETDIGKIGIAENNGKITNLYGVIVTNCTGYSSCFRKDYNQRVTDLKMKQFPI
jgi:hypothetical protein